MERWETTPKDEVSKNRNQMAVDDLQSLFRPVGNILQEKNREKNEKKLDPRWMEDIQSASKRSTSE